MTDDRAARPRHAVPPRFRCRVCRVFVTGSAIGTCPRCGLAPPRVAVIAGDRRGRPAWVVAAAVVTLIGAILLALARM